MVIDVMVDFGDFEDQGLDIMYQEMLEVGLDAGDEDWCQGWRAGAVRAGGRERVGDLDGSEFSTATGGAWPRPTHG